MQRDIRQTPTYKETHKLYRRIWSPGPPDSTDSSDPYKGYEVNEAQHIQASPDGRCALFTGISAYSLEQPPASDLFEIELDSARLKQVINLPGCQQQAKYSKDGQSIAFLSDHLEAGNFQLYIHNRKDNQLITPPAVDGWVEQLQWSADGSQILLTVAGHGADRASGQGAVKSHQAAEQFPGWMPQVETGVEAYRWRQAWIYTVASNRVKPVPGRGLNIWQATWCGDSAIAAIVSDSPNEEAWYSADLQLIQIESGAAELLYKPRDQLSCIAATESGQTLAFVEALGSDRDIIAGNLFTIDIHTRERKYLNTLGVDITYTQWLSEEELLLAGHRGFETLILSCLQNDRVPNGHCEELWCSSGLTSSGHFITVSAIPAKDTQEVTSRDCLIIAESFFQAPEIGLISQGSYQTLKSFDQGYNREAAIIKSAEQVCWTAADGLEIQGWLLCPQGSAPYPTVMDMHGGPVWQWRPHWLGRRLHTLMLVQKGYAVFFPNPRGSAGRGQDYSKLVLGDLGGADTHDYLSGIDHLVEQGLADSQRLGVMGHSYGGYMAAWLITQDQRFAAAVLSAPMTNYISQHLLSNISHFVSLFLRDHYKNSAGKYLQRSPVMFAHQVSTPTLSLSGALDQCTPPAEATQFHRALLENRVESILVTYPREGHGIRGVHERIDYSARIVSWITKHLSKPNDLATEKVCEVVSEERS